MVVGTGRGEPPGCANIQDSLRHYFASLLPDTPKNFAKTLGVMEFRCESYLGHGDMEYFPWGADKTHPEVKAVWSCGYSKIQPPESCIVATRVSMRIAFFGDAPKMDAKDLHIESRVFPDPENHDNAGCFPL